MSSMPAIAPVTRKTRSFPMSESTPRSYPSTRRGSTSPQISRAAVLGAGVMGAQIAALLANAGIHVDLLDLPADDAADGLARRGRERLLGSRPPALFLSEYAERIHPGSLDDLRCLGQAEWIIEAVVEQLDVKRALLARVEEAASDEAVISSNTSGLSIGAMAAACTDSFRTRFLGIHFFNPPRLMKLVELVPGPDTDPQTVAGMRHFLEEGLGKGAVEARDTPNFIANRLGVFALMQALHGMAEQGLNAETVDGVTGQLLGRPRSATLRLCDLIGLDTLVNVARTAFVQLPEELERSVFAAPEFVADMLERGLLGAKSGAGFYRKAEQGIEVLDLGNMEYRPSHTPDLGDVGTAVRQRSLAARLAGLWQDDGPPARYARENFCRVLGYAAAHGEEMAGDIVQIDQALRWGFNWEAGPFELWDAAGVDTVVAEIEKMGLEAPAVALRVAAGAGRFYREGEGGGSVYSFSGEWADSEISPQNVAVPDRSSADYGNECGYLTPLRDGVGAVVFDSKMNVLGPKALELVRRAVEEATFSGLVLWGAGEPFSVGADLHYMVGLSAGGSWDELESYVREFQQAIMALRFAPFPVVAAPKGLTLGGGCEICLGADARVAVSELKIGLVETSVGLIPGGGGCKELVRRGRGHLRAFETVVGGVFTDNAHQARGWHLLDDDDEILVNPDRQLGRAVETAISLAEAGYEPPLHVPVSVGGAEAERQLVAWLEAAARAAPEKRRPSEHDLLVGRRLAWVMSGGGGAPRDVEERELLDLEREVFMELCGIDKTRERMAHMLKTGKPLRN